MGKVPVIKNEGTKTKGRSGPSPKQYAKQKADRAKEAMGNHITDNKRGNKTKKQRVAAGVAKAKSKSFNKQAWDAQKEGYHKIVTK